MCVINQPNPNAKMANNQDLEVKQEDFSEDVQAGDEDDQMNGGDSQNDQTNGSNGGGQNGSAEAPGRDDDR